LIEGDVSEEVASNLVEDTWRQRPEDGSLLRQVACF